VKDRVIEVGYRRLPPIQPGRGHAARTIARWALTLAWRKRATKISLAACAMIAMAHALGIVVVVLLQAAGNVGDSTPLAAMSLNIDRIVGNTQEVLSSFVSAQTYFTVIALAVIGGGFIAEDRRYGAFDLYFARALRRRDYLMGKLLAAGAVPALTIALPFVLLWLLAVGIAPSTLRLSLLWLFVPGLIGALVTSVVLTVTLLGVSALGERGRTIGVVFVFGWLLLSAVGESLASNGLAAAGYLSPARDVATMMEALLDAGPASAAAAALELRGSVNPSALLSALSLLGFASLGLGALVGRIRREVGG
jgi:ABC-type transport system involved in multi-copper enzyme maturation permease subunit